MCTVVVLRRPGHEWPLLLAANRDELRTRPSRPPARHWPDRPEVVAGLDLLAEGSWLGVNDHGLVACVLESQRHPRPASRTAQPRRVGAGGPGPRRGQGGRRRTGGSASGRLPPLQSAHRATRRTATGCAMAATARSASTRCRRSAHACRGRVGRCREPRIARFLPAFRAAPEPQPAADGGDWQGWIALLRRACRRRCRRRRAPCRHEPGRHRHRRRALRHRRQQPGGHPGLSRLRCAAGLPARRRPAGPHALRAYRHRRNRCLADQP
jgi:hypothetical protein